MPRFFVRADAISNENCEDIITLLGDDAHHISYSLRMAVGEKIEVCDMKKNLYVCMLTKLDGSTVKAKILSKSVSDTEPKHYIRLYQALPKSDKMDVIVQKSVECGVCEIIPFISERCISKPDKKSLEKKTERWQKIAESAAKQSGRGIIPEVKNTVSFDEMIKNISKESLVVFCYEGENETTFKKLLSNKELPHDISIIIGCEGGFSVDEAEKIKGTGGNAVSLGKRILRCETAPIYALCAVSYETEL